MWDVGCGAGDQGRGGRGSLPVLVSVTGRAGPVGLPVPSPATTLSPCPPGPAVKSTGSTLKPTAESWGDCPRALGSNHSPSIRLRGLGWGWGLPPRPPRACCSPDGSPSGSGALVLALPALLSCPHSSARALCPAQPALCGPAPLPPWAPLPVMGRTWERAWVVRACLARRSKGLVCSARVDMVQPACPGCLGAECPSPAPPSRPGGTRLS